MGLPIPDGQQESCIGSVPSKTTATKKGKATGKQAGIRGKAKQSGHKESPQVGSPPKLQVATGGNTDRKGQPKSRTNTLCNNSLGVTVGPSVVTASTPASLTAFSVLTPASSVTTASSFTSPLVLSASSSFPKLVPQTLPKLNPVQLASLLSSSGCGSLPPGTRIKVVPAAGQILTSGDHLPQPQLMHSLNTSHALGIVNPDGTVTQLTHVSHPQVQVSLAASGVSAMKTATSSSGQTVSLAQGQLVTQSAQGVQYQILQPQQVQTISIDGQEAIFIPASSLGGQSIQIAGNQIFSPQNQTIVRAQNQNAQQNQQSVSIQNMAGLQSNVQFAQIPSGQTVVRQGNVVQTLQLPVNAIQQTIPVQIPLTTSNGQTLYQTVHIPLHTLQALSGGGSVTAQVLPQTQAGNQIQVQQGNQQHTTQQTTQVQVKQEPGVESNQNQVRF